MQSVDRARAYVAAMPPAISGQGGHAATFAAACALVHGFALSESEALSILSEYSARCVPPWREIDLRHKIKDAAKGNHPKQRGHLLGESRVSRIASQPRAATQTPAEPERAKPKLPDLQKGAPADFDKLAKLRGIGREGLEFASERGLLWFATIKDFPAWIVTDGDRFNAQARRMDGKPWEHIGDKKAYTLPGAWAAWPIGITEAQPFSSIALVEGGPDFLAAHYLALWEQASQPNNRDVRCVPVAMLGASQRIHAEALPSFKGKRVRIFGHDDESGRDAVTRWAQQLATVGANVDAFDFAGLRKSDGSLANDLNDCLTLDAIGQAETERMLP